MIGKVVNIELIRHPMNWIIVFVMCVLALAFLSIAFPQSSFSDT